MFCDRWDDMLELVHGHSSLQFGAALGGSIISVMGAFIMAGPLALAVTSLGTLLALLGTWTLITWDGPGGDARGFGSKLFGLPILFAAYAFLALAIASAVNPTGGPSPTAVLIAIAAAYITVMLGVSISTTRA